MRTISDTMARLAAMRRPTTENGTAMAGRLIPLETFGSNPGALQGHVYVPASLAAHAALVVVLHGCTQTAASYDVGSGWSEMADRHGFMLLFPEQRQANNPNLCFNWFADGDNRRDVGEALSIRQMVAAIVETHPVDPERVFVTGLSAGGAMTAVMLATYPEVFAGGAIIAGLPYGCASGIPQAFDRMRGYGMPGTEQLAAAIRRASAHRGSWPIVSIWHGAADTTVSPSNAEAIRAQWGVLHGTSIEPDRVDSTDGRSRKVWCNAQGREVIESFVIDGMGHGTPLSTTGQDACGKTGPFMLEAGISSIGHICRFWGLDDGLRDAHPKRTAAMAAPGRELAPAARVSTTQSSEPLRATTQAQPAETPMSGAEDRVRKVIESALRSAGLMR